MGYRRLSSVEHHPRTQDLSCTSENATIAKIDIRFLLRCRPWLLRLGAKRTWHLMPYFSLEMKFCEKGSEIEVDEIVELNCKAIKQIYVHSSDL